MKINYSSGILILLIGIFITISISQDFDRYTEPIEIEYFSNSPGFSATDTYPTGSIWNGTFFALGTDVNYISFPVSSIASYESTGRTEDAQSIQYTTSQDTPNSCAVTDNLVFSLGTIKIYRAGANNLDELTFTGNQQYTGIQSYSGGVSFGQKVYFLANKNDASAADPSVLLYINQANTVDFFNSSSYSEFLLSSEIQLPTSIVTDQTMGIAFIGDSDGDIQIFNMNDNTAGFLYQNASITDSRSAGVVDSTRKILYICGGSSASVDSDIIYVDVFTYTVTSLTLINRFSIKGSMCASAGIDAIGGQLFFSTTTKDGSQLVGTDTDGENQGLFSTDLNKAQSIAMNVDTDAMRVDIFYDTGLYTANYRSVCPSNCSGAGFCDYGVCKCNYNYEGEGCEIQQCYHLNNCTDLAHGECQNGVCFCTSIYKGDSCSERRCENDCSGFGTCNVTDYTCICDDQHQGPTCNDPVPPPPCSFYTDSDGCLSRTTCGWCEVDGVCQEGDRYGPFEGFCRTWFFDTNVETGVIALAIIFIAFIGILYLIDIGTTIPVDIRRAKDYKEEYKSGQHPKATHEEASVLWWRDQRSHKAWTFMDQFQFISLVSHIGVIFPSRFISFSEYLDWSNLGIPFPPSISPPQIWSVPEDWAVSDNGRATLAMAQYENSLGTGDLYLLPNILFWFGLLLAAFLVPLLLVLAIISCMERLVHWKEVVTNRIIHISVRLLTFGYIGVLLAASFAMVTPLNDYRIIIPGAIIFVLYGIGLPLAIWFILRVPEARLHNPTFKQQFGCLYVHFKPKTDHRFIIFMFIKRFIMAVIVGILAFKPMPSYPLAGTDLAVPIVQVAVIDIALIGYAILLFIRKPYFDHYQLWLEYLLTAINIVTVSLSLTHIKSPSPAGELIACLIQALALVACIAAYVISWLQMRSAFIKKVKKFLCCCCKSDKTTDGVKLDKAQS